LDSDLNTCKTLILKWFDDRLQIIKPGNEQKDPKTRLQEFLQGRKIDLPSYEVIDTTGQSHNQQFTVRCQTSIINEVVIAKGTSRRKAEQQAAEQILLLIAQSNSKNESAKQSVKQTKSTELYHTIKKTSKTKLGK
jgi:ribonuclease-3